MCDEESYSSDSEGSESESDSEDEDSYGSSEQRSIMFSQKKQRSIIENGSGEDRISAFPDLILAHILSLLPTTKEAIKTSKLSKRWRFLWTSVTSLSFSHPKRISSVADTLSQITSPKLQKFKVEIDAEKHIQRLNLISNWIRFAVGRNVEELYICLRYYFDDKAYRLPECLFSNSDFTGLAFRGKFEMEPEGSISWKMLRNLRIEGTKLTHHMITNILSGSPMLETLELGECYGFDSLDIDSPKIRKLVLDGYHTTKWPPTIVLKITAPYILLLEILGTLRLEDIVLLDVRALLRAKFMFSFSGTRIVAQDKDKWKGLLQSVNHVGKLSVGSSYLQVLSHFEEPLDSTPFKSKYLETEFRRNCLRGLVKLLQGLPDLESLIIMENPCYYSGAASLVVDDHLSFKNCDFAHLKTVKIIYSDDYALDLIELVQFLLKSARALEEIIIQAGNLFPKKHIRKPGQGFDTAVSSASVPTQRLFLVIKKLFGLCQTDKAVIQFEGFDI